MIGKIKVVDILGTYSWYWKLNDEEKATIKQMMKDFAEVVIDKYAEEAEINYDEEKTWDFIFVDKKSILNMWYW